MSNVDLTLVIFLLPSRFIFFRIETTPAATQENLHTAYFSSDTAVTFEELENNISRYAIELMFTIDLNDRNKILQ